MCFVFGVSGVSALWMGVGGRFGYVWCVGPVCAWVRCVFACVRVRGGHACVSGCICMSV